VKSVFFWSDDSSYEPLRVMRMEIDKDDIINMPTNSVLTVTNMVMIQNIKFSVMCIWYRLPLWSSGQSSWLQLAPTSPTDKRRSFSRCNSLADSGHGVSCLFCFAYLISVIGTWILYFACFHMKLSTNLCFMYFPEYDWILGYDTVQCSRYILMF
jgi:hypothetical protein